MVEQLHLTDMESGETGTIVEVLGGSGAHRRLRALGIRHGVKITKVSGAFARGPVVIQIGSTQAVLGFGVSSKVIVRVDR